MQRILSLATLGILGGLVWMFLSGGGLSQLASDPNAANPQGIVPGAGFNYSGTWNAPGADAGVPASGSPAVQPTTAGSAAPPLGSGPTITIASFNIQDFGDAKAARAPVMYALAEIVRRFHVVAIQGISTKNEYHMPNFVKLVNSTGRHYDHVVSERVGNSTGKEQHAFVFDADCIELDRQSVYTVRDPDNLLSREPLVASFRTRMRPEEAFTFILINVHTDPDVVPAELEALAEVYRVVRQAGRGEDDVIMLGDFNADDSHLGRLGQIPGIKPLLRGVFSNTRQNKLHDNIVVHLPSTTEYAGVSRVFDIRKEFKLNLSLADLEQISDHLPVCAEFSAYERDYEGRIASRRTNAR